MRVVNIDHMAYRDGLRLMRSLAERKRAVREPEVLIITEHESVLTMGRQGSTDDILISDRQLADLGLRVHAIERGGLVTYHGPGQIMAYPIFDLRRLAIGVADFVHLLEDIILASLETFEIKGHKRKDHPGAWVGPAKIASIGLAVKGGISMHGLALNCQPDLAMFENINPCGVTGMQQTSMSELLGRPVDNSRVREEIVFQFSRHLGLEPRQWDLAQVMAEAGLGTRNAG